MSHGWQERYCYVPHPIFQLWLLLVSVRVAQLRLRAIAVIISIVSESIIQIEKVIQNFVLKYSKSGFYCDLTWNMVYPFPVNFRKVKLIWNSVLWGRFLHDQFEKQIVDSFNWNFLYIDVGLPHILISQAKGIPTWRSTASFLTTLFHVFDMAFIIRNHFIA